MTSWPARVLALSLALVACRASSAPSAGASSTASSSPAAANACGALDCRLYPTARDAIEDALASNPTVVAFGEAHAQKGASVPSSAKRFTTELLPMFQGRASDLLVEAMMPPTGCAKSVADVRSAHAPVHEKQAPTDQSEYVAMGNAARALGIVPDLLRPSCDDLAAIDDAGADAVEATLETIRRLVVAQVSRLLTRADHRMVIVYGGALHNDLAPPAERAAWSYAPELAAKSGGKLVAIDLFVPEMITDDASWKAFAWYPLFVRGAHPGEATMYRPRDATFVVLFPETAR
jgi:hypothetical protein